MANLVFGLYQLGWFDLAASAGMDWLHRFEPDQWGEKPRKNNPYFKGGAITTPGKRVRNLARIVVSSAQQLAAVTDEQTARSLFNDALSLQAEFDPDAVRDNLEEMQIVILIQEGEYEEAAATAETYGKELADLAGGKPKGPDLWEVAPQTILVFTYGNAGATCCGKSSSIPLVLRRSLKQKPKWINWPKPWCSSLVVC